MLTEEQVKEIKKQLIKEIEKLPKEQQEELKEQIEEAKAEEIEEFIKRQQENQKCIFCEIVAGRIPAIKIYEDSDILSIMEIMPASQGHLLIMPKQHFQFIQEIPNKLLEKLFYFTKLISPILVNTLNAKSLSIYIPQGILAGQRIPHFIINLIPRYKEDNLVFDWEHKKADEKELEKIAEKIRKASQTEVIKGIKEEQEEYEKKKREEQESEAEKIFKHIKKRIP